MTTPAGWYDDGSGRQRWFDGTQWTEHLQEVVQTPPVEAAVQAPPVATAYQVPTPPQTAAAAPYSPAAQYSPGAPYSPAAQYSPTPQYAFGAAAPRRNGLVLAGGIIGVIRGLFGTIVGLTTVPALELVEPMIPGISALIGFEIVLSIAILAIGIFAIVSANKPSRARGILICGIAIIAAGVIDLIWGIALMGGAPETIGSSLGSVVALSLIGALLGSGARRLGAQR